MKQIKTALLLLLCCLTLVLPITGCSPKDDATEPTGDVTEPTGAPDSISSATIRLGGLKGPTTMGMVKMLSDAEADATFNKIIFTLAGSADELTPKLISAAPELDILAVPANLASVLYNNTEGKVQLLAVNTLGVIYIVENGNAVSGLEDLRGKTIYATGRGSTPEYALTHILRENGIDPETDVTIDWKSEPTEIVALMQQQPGSVAMLPQPYVTVAQNTLPDLRIAVDLTAAWDELDSGSALITGVLVVRKEFAEQYPDQIAKFLEEYRASTAYTDTNPDETALLIEQYGIVNAAIAKKALPYCNITYLAGDEMKQAMQGYLQVLFDQNPKSVGGTLPGDDFYYGAQ